MQSIDERVVAMAFENAKFEAAIAQTMKTLDQLNKSLAQVGASSGFDKIEAQANKVNLQGPMSAIDRLKQKLGMGVNAKPLQDMEAAGNKVTLNGPMSALDKLKQKLAFVGGGNELQSIQGQADRVDLSNLDSQLDQSKSHFDALRFAAIVAFGTIVHKATNAGLALAKKLTVQPLIDGFKNYETQINAVQTIQANTGLTGKKGLNQIKGALGNLNEYANKTVYNFSEMAKNIGTFTAAGVDLKTATGSIKGIANLAAASGSTSQQASTAMYQLSQAIAAGRVNLQDWNSVVNAGMGGQMFQKALVNTAEAMGTLDEKSVTMGKHMKINGESFRQAIASKPGQKSWLTGDVLTQTLQNFTGDMTDAQLAAKGFNAEQIKAIQSQAKVAVDAATKIKTFSQMMEALKEEVASAWSGVWSTLFGDIGQAKALFTPLHNVLQNLLTGPVNGFNKALKSWAKLGGRKMLFEALKNGFKGLGQILGAIHKAFRDIFPAATGKSLLEMTKHFANFANAIKASPETLNNLRGTFRGLFAVLDIGWQIVKKVVGVIFDLLGVAKGGAGGFLAFTGGIGNFLTAIDNAIKKGHALDGFFNGLTAVLRVPLHILGLIAHAFFGLFGGVDSAKADTAAKSIGTVSDSLKPMGKLVDSVKNAWQDLVNFFDKLKAKFGPAIHQALEPITHIGETIANAFKNINPDRALKIIQTGLLAGLFVTLRKGLTGGVSVTVGKLDGINKVLGALTGNLKTMQQSIKAKMLFEIAGAIALLAGGVALLSTIDPAALTKAMTAVAVGLGELVGAMALLGAVSKGSMGLSMAVTATSMVALAAAVVILAAAVKIFSTMSWGDLIKGLVGVGGALTAIGLGMKAIGAVRMTAMAPGLIAVALAMNLLALAVKQFGNLSWKEIARGLFGMTGALIALAFSLDQFGPQTLLMGPALIAVAIAMTMLAGAIGAFGAMNWKTLGKGLAGVTAALLLIGAALWEMPPGPMLAAQAAGLFILSLALGGITAAVRVLGGMSVFDIAKGLIALGGALFELAVGLDIMTASAPGAVALLGVSAGLALLAPTLAFMGTLKWGTIFKGLAAIAASLLVLSVVGEIASAGLLALGIALTAMAAAVLVAGTGIFLIGKGLSSMSETGSRAVAVMIAAMTAFILAIPGLIISFLKGLVEALAAVAKIAPQVVDSLTKIVMSLLQVIINATPKMVQAIEGLLGAFIKVVNDKSGPLIAAGWKLLLNFLSGIASHIGAVVNHAATIVTTFLSTLADRMPGIMAAGARLIIAFLKGVGDHIEGALAAGARVVRKFLAGVAKAIPGVVGGVVRIIVAFLGAVADHIPKIVRAGTHLARKFIHAVAGALVALTDAGATALIRFIRGLAKTINKRAPELWDAGFELAKAIVKGFGYGIKRLGDKVKSALTDWAGGDSTENMRKLMRDLDNKARKQGRTTHFEADFNRKHPPKGRPSGPKKRKQVAFQGPHKMVVDEDGNVTDLQPTITPVVDLTNVVTAGKQINDTLGVRPKRSTAHAAVISDRTHRAQTKGREQPPAREVNFTQNNYSPEALPPREIYRRTKTMVGSTKVRLGLT